MNALHPTAPECYPGHRQDQQEDHRITTLLKLRALARVLQATCDEVPLSTETLQHYAYLMEEMIDRLLDYPYETEIGTETSPL